ncbi:hypothetical protein [Desulfovirgula thermocuniculi]|uniref:hypothetical protein n=1 Tax=Desulfovirgula thermocuniculi TaxID=348842 RepID=UPI0003FDE27B|nr:hypothetical protein [Desulfovirgula thermocuniculi]
MSGKSYRVKFRVPPDVAEVLDAQGDRAGYVARAVTWYARFGEPCLRKLDQLLEMAAAGVLQSACARKEGEEGEGGSVPALAAEVDDAFSGFAL